jgi:2-polyprenyl-6-hydroxyphenyl methylase/3-demethylubiquinone-9 3-methyltransferase
MKTEDAAFARDTIDEADLAKYDRLGESWWDPKGPMGQLHKFNPVRVGYIRDTLAAGRREKSLEGCRILDVGSGGGILSESLARLGATMVGIDPAPNNVGVAARHAEKAGLSIDYRCTTIATLAAGSDLFDAVLVMEVVEHVKDVRGFLGDCARCVKPGGFLFGATLNRTLKSYALAIVGAEYVLGWLPRGTHDWRQFVTPAEFRGHLRGAGLTPAREAGVSYNPLTDSWALSKDMACNYMLVAQRPS